MEGLQIYLLCMLSIGKSYCWISAKKKSETAKFSLQVLTQCFVLSCNQFLYQVKLISWGSLIPPRYLALEPRARSSDQEGGSIRAGQAGVLNNAQVASAPEGQHTDPKEWTGSECWEEQFPWLSTDLSCSWLKWAMFSGRKALPNPRLFENCGK